MFYNTYDLRFWTHIILCLFSRLLHNIECSYLGKTLLKVGFEHYGGAAPGDSFSDNPA